MGSLDSSYAGETGSYNVTDNWSYNGKYSLRGSGNPVEIFCNSGLPTYPQRGDTIRIIIHLNRVPQDTWCDPEVGFYFGGDSINNCYRTQQTVWQDPETNSLGVSLINTDGASSESSDNVQSYDSGDVISWEIEFGDPEITLKTYTGAWKTLEKQISISDSNYNGTGIGFLVNTRCSNRNTEADFDYIHVN